MYIYSEMPKWLAKGQKKSITHRATMKYFFHILDDFVRTDPQRPLQGTQRGSRKLPTLEVCR